VKLDATAAPDAVKSTMRYIAKLTGSMRKDLAAPDKSQNASDTLNDWLTK
jgi:hypothetical protein